MTTITASTQKRLSGLRRRRALRRVPWFLAVPAFFFLTAFHIIPMFAGGWYAFTDWNGISAHADWIGLHNFRQIFKESASRNALYHTLELAGSFVVLVNVIGLLLALGLNRSVKSRNVLRSLFFAPVVVSPLAVAYIFQYVFDYRGPINELFGGLGLDSWKRPWLGDPKTALWMVLIVLVWQFSGLTMVIYLAGLQGIPDELSEASAVDGATAWMRFRRIIFPLLAPAFTVNATLTLIFGLRVFDQVLGLTGGGPVDATETLATQVWKQTWVSGRFGYGASLALVLASMISVMAITQSLILRRREARV
jgi:raffinose/stachyose/melibiose transport system permease protein